MQGKNIIFDLNGVLFIKEGSKFIPLQEGVLLLRACHAHQHGLYVCSNMQPHYLEQIQTDYPHIMTLFKGVVTPDRAPAVKPDPRIFDHLLELYGLIAEDCLLLDDMVRNIEAAQQIGMSGIHVQHFDQVRKELKNLGLLSQEG